MYSTCMLSVIVSGDYGGVEMWSESTSGAEVREAEVVELLLQGSRVRCELISLPWLVGLDGER